MALPTPRPTHRHGSSNLTFRKRIPADLRGKVTGQSVLIHFPAHGHEPECTVAATLGASEVTFSLRTRDPQTAKARTGIAEDHLQRLFVSLRTGPTRLSQKQAVALAGAWYRDFVARLEDNPGKSLVFEKLQQAVGERLDDSSALRAEMAPFVDDLLSARALVVDDDSRELLATAMRGAIRDAAGTLLRRAEGDCGPDAVVQRFPSEAALPRPEIGGAAKTPSTGKGVTLTGLAEAWGRERQPRAKTLEEHLRVVKAFVAFVKHDDATAITPEDVVGWKDALVAEGRLAAKTINAKYLTPLGTVLNWGKANRKITSNPAQGIRSSGKAPPRTRDRSFTHEEAATILKAALHAYDAPGRNAPEMLAARR